jgi:rhodanese-related sulfurtransferase
MNWKSEWRPLAGIAVVFAAFFYLPIGSVGFDNAITVLHIPVDETPDRIDEVPRDRIVVIFCSAGTRSAIVYAYLRSLGYENVRLAPGGHEAVTNLMLPGELLKHIR